MQTHSPTATTQARPVAAALVRPAPSMLAALIQSRVDAEARATSPAALPRGVERDLRPRLPKVGQAAIMLYAHHRAVDSYPLIYTTLALAHPN